nr:hypothetical protein [Rhizobium leguminosarum]
MAAAARSRALYRGAEPRLDPFSSSELAPFLGGPAGTKRLHSADPATHLAATANNRRCSTRLHATGGGSMMMQTSEEKRQ